MALKDEFAVPGLIDDPRAPPSPERLAAQQQLSARLSGLPDQPVRAPAGPLPETGAGRVAGRIASLANETVPRVGGFVPKSSNPALAGLRAEMTAPPSAATVAAQNALSQRLSGLGGPEPVRIPPAAPAGAAPAATGPWYNRPVGGIIRSLADKGGDAAGRAGKATMGAVNANAGILGRAASLGGKVAPAVGAAIETVDATRDAMTPGMTGIDKTARVAEGVGRFAGGAAGMAGGAALGAMTGPLAPIAVPAGAVVGGILGAAAPTLANKAYNAITGSDNQLPSEKAAELRTAQAPAAASPVATQAPRIVGGLSAAGAGRGVVNPAAVVPDQSAAPASASGVPQAGIIRRMAPPAAAPVAAGILTPQAEAGGPVEFIRGMERTMTSPELGLGNEIAKQEYDALAQQPDGIQNYLNAVAQGRIDASAPEQAKMNTALAVQGLQNEGSANNAAISAGPAYNAAQLRAQAEANELALKRELEDRDQFIPGQRVRDLQAGTESITSPMFVNRKDRKVTPIEPSSTTAPQLPPGMKRQVGTYGGKPVYEDKDGKRFIGG